MEKENKFNFDSLIQIYYPNTNILSKYNTNKLNFDSRGGFILLVGWLKTYLDVEIKAFHLRTKELGRGDLK